MKKLVCSLLSLACINSYAVVQDNSSQSEEQLQLFHLAPKFFMNQIPTKRGDKGKLPLVDEEGRPVENWPEQKMAGRDQFFDRIEQKGEIQGNDLVEELTESSNFPRSLTEMESLGLTQAVVSSMPWSDDYWPIYKGILGARYTDPQFESIFDFVKAYDYVAQRPAINIFKGQDPVAKDQLSPAEKYDYLFGEAPVLTPTQWAQGKAYQDAYGKVETWMGICHGWAPAAFMMKRPLNKVVVPAYDGTPINFYPSDIKALTSLVWATTQFPTGFIGGRCDVKDPSYDEIGRITDPNCFDNNPGSWHQAVVALVGQEKRSFVIDVSFDYEVWNQPMVGYKYSYFNPQTLKAVDSLEEATVTIEEFTIDKFKKYRSPKAKKVVGINMDLTYVVESNPTHRTTDRVEYDHHSSVSYLYDLELDEEGKIIGGEWYQNAHPDFLWVPLKNARPLTAGDYFLLAEPLWDGKTSVSPVWVRPSRSSARRGQPLLKMVESLVELSQQQN